MKETVTYKRTVKGSVGAGMGALFNASGKQYYILEHKNASKYYRAGESQKIIIDQIELGRASSCQVRFDDESWPTVSRKHAAIEKDEQGWKIVPLSQTNSTLVNGRVINNVWYLQNGDEIQLSVNGPKLGFIIPAGKQSLVSSIRMTERLNLFRKQALRPYKTAIACLFALLVVSCGVAGVIISDQNHAIEEHAEKIDSLQVDKEMMAKVIETNQKKMYEDSLKWAEKLKEGEVKIGQTLEELRQLKANMAVEQLLTGVKSSVYFIETTVFVEDSETIRKLGSYIGSAFLLNDGTFVTARHCVEPWMFDVQELQLIYAFSKTYPGIKIYAEIVAINDQGQVLKFRSDEFIMDKSKDAPFEVKYNDNVYVGGLAFSDEESLGNDWAYVKASKKGNIVNGKDYSDKLKSSANLHLLGFPKGNGFGDGEKLVEPIYNKLTVSRDGLSKSRCIMVNQGVDHGNSGGPVFVVKDGKLYVVGIVSRGDSKSELYNHLVPMCNLK